jgi:hypothetical protein
VFGILLIVATTGFTISKHYCGNQLSSVSIFNAEKCGCVGLCHHCHTVIKQVKVADDYSAPDAIHPDAPFSTDLNFVYNIDLSNFTFPSASTSYILLEAPPPGKQNPFALLQSFRC